VNDDEPRLQALLVDFLEEAARSTRAMPPLAKAAYVLGLLGFVVFALVAPPAIPSGALAALRVASLALFIAAAVANARASDDLFRRVYLVACAIALPIATLALYAVTALGVPVTTPVLGFVVLLWFVCVIAFVAVRRP
jgi:hypothetical protein